MMNKMNNETPSPVTNFCGTSRGTTPKKTALIDFIRNISLHS
jgi:hypothetical protein